MEKFQGNRRAALGGVSSSILSQQLILIPDCSVQEAGRGAGHWNKSGSGLTCPELAFFSAGWCSFAGFGENFRSVSQGCWSPLVLPLPGVISQLEPRSRHVLQRKGKMFPPASFGRGRGARSPCGSWSRQKMNLLSSGMVWHSFIVNIE